MAEITDEILKEFKGSMKISHSSEDDNLKSLLNTSITALSEMCGEFGWNDVMGKELVFNRARYAYNDLLEFFSQNFRSDINNLTIKLMSSEDEEESDGS